MTLFKEHSAGYKRPKKIYFFSKLPKNLYGNILRKELEERFEGL